MLGLPLLEFLIVQSLINKSSPICGEFVFMFITGKGVQS